ncbi:bacteriocin [Archaeoglobales archaeon]|nr:MAG: bacteriocin [Archaeoglobales archaeon]
MYIAKVKVSQHSCSLAYVTRKGNFSMQILEYILLNDLDAAFLCRIDKINGNVRECFKTIEKHKSTKFLQIFEKTPVNIDFIAVIRDTAGIKAFEESYCFVKPPIKVRNGNKYYTVFAPDIKHLKMAYEKLRKVGNWSVTEVKPLTSEKSVLTNSQQRVLKAAYDMGYFSTKRKVNLDEIADAVGISKSMAHKHVKDAIARIVSDYIENYERIPEDLFE